MRPYSIVRRLIVVMLLVELLAAVVVSALALGHERHERFQAFDVMLRGRADSLLGAVQQAGDEADTVMLDGTEASLPKDDLYVVAAQGGAMLGRSGNWTQGEADRALAHPVEGRGTFRRNGGVYFPLEVDEIHYVAVRVQGVRMVDPGEKGGGIARRVTIVYASPVDRVWHEVSEAVRFYAWMSVGVMVVTGLLMAWLLRRGLAPLRELAAEASTVSVRSWEFAPSERVMATKELRPLAVALGDVLEGLKESFLQRDRFVSDAAHELKTGVAVVKSSLQLLTMRERTAAEYASGLERTQVDCERMEAIVGKMLLLARAEHHEERLGLAPAVETSVAAAVRGVVVELAPMAEARGVAVVLEAEEGTMVAAEPDELHLVFVNLAQNAMQHSAAGSVVKIVARRVGPVVETSVEDSGSGIAEEDLPHVFERFYRGDRSRSRNTGGTGLGLAICKAIATRLGGSIEMESVVGAGTSVTVRLPVARGR
jgi:signal transduction histidine kinase